MPAIHLFGRRTLLGGDDLQVPALLTIFARLIQWTCLVIPLGVLIYRQQQQQQQRHGKSSAEFQCSGYNNDASFNDDNFSSSSMTTTTTTTAATATGAQYFMLLCMMYLVTTTLFCIASWILEYRLYYWSCQGTPTSIRQPRSTIVESLLEYKLGVMLVGESVIIVTFLVAVIGFAKSYHQCATTVAENSEGALPVLFVGSKLWWALATILFLSQSSEVFVGTLLRWRLVRPLKPEGSEIDGTTTEDDHEIHELTEELWSDRCQKLCYCLSISTCFLFGGHDIVANARQQTNRRRHHRRSSSMGGVVTTGTMTDIVATTTTTTPGGGGGDIYSHLAQALADYLETRGTLDVVPTDLVTGLLILQRLQRQRILQARRDVMVMSQQNTTTTTTSDQYRGDMILSNGTSSVVPTLPTSDFDNAMIVNQPADELLVERIASPASSTGLRSRVSSSNDLTRRSTPPSSLNSTVSPQKHQQQQQRAILRQQSSSTGSSSNGSTGRPKTPTSNVSETARLVSSVPTNVRSVLSRPQQEQPPLSIHMSLSGGGGGTGVATTTMSPLFLQQPIYRRCHSTDKNQGYFHATDTLGGGGRLTTATGGAAGVGPTTEPPRRSERPYYRSFSRQVLNPNDQTDVSRLEEGARMAKYALSIYTWMLYVYVNPVSGLSKLCCRSCKVCCIHRMMSISAAQRPSANSDGRVGRRRRRLSSREDVLLDVPSGVSPTSVPSSSSSSSSHDRLVHDTRQRTYGDNICEWHKHALMLVAGLPESDLVYAQFHNRFSMVPYCILLDHDHSVVVVSIRGSLSLEDIVTDTLVQPEPLDDLGEKYGFDGKDQYCHAGVRSCFENVFQDLQRHGLLEQLLEQDYPEYELRIVGHSLGAGVATLLSYVLQPQFPTLKVFGFSPPGCTMTWDLATKCQAWTTSFVLDNEIVPRLSVLALEDLRDEVLDLIGRVKVPKYQVFQTFMKVPRNVGCCLNDRTVDDDDLEELTGSISEVLDDVPRDSLYQRQLKEFLQVQDERKEARGSTNSRQVRLYPTGRMIHLMKTGAEAGCSHLMNNILTCGMSNSGFHYTPVYIGNDDLDEIVVSPTMGTDHFIDRMCDELHKLSDRYSEQSAAGEAGRDSISSDHHEMV